MMHDQRPQYLIVKAADVPLLCERVCKSMEMGYAPSGGLFADSSWYYQPMVLVPPDGPMLLHELVP